MATLISCIRGLSHVSSCTPPVPSPSLPAKEQVCEPWLFPGTIPGNKRNIRRIYYESSQTLQPLVRPTARRQEGCAPPRCRQRQLVHCPLPASEAGIGQNCRRGAADVIAADTAMEELTDRPALPASAEDEAARLGLDRNQYRRIRGGVTNGSL